MKNKEIDQLTKDLLSKSAPKLSSNFEENIMMQISKAPVKAKPFAITSMLWALAASVVLVTLFIVEVSFLDQFNEVPYLLKYLPNLARLSYFDKLKGFQIPVLMFLGGFGLYFFDLFLSDLFRKRILKT